MRRNLRSRRFRIVVAAVGLASAAAAVPAAATAGAAEAALTSRVVGVFPTDDLTVPDPGQITGRRVNLPLADCAARPSDCDEVRLLNQLDGFDLVPRIAITFDGPVDLSAVSERTVFVRRAAAGGGDRIGLTRLVLDPATATLYGEPERILRESTRYQVVVRARLAGERTVASFTTLSATSALVKMRRTLDDGSAYGAAGIAPAERGLRFVAPDGTRTVFPADQVRTITRVLDRGTATATAAVPVPNTAFSGASLYAFGRFSSPSWLTPERFVEAVPTTQVPSVKGRDEVGFALVVPAGTPPPGGWPVAVFGHGFTGSKLNLFLAADFNAARGYATAAVDVVGHGFGPRSETAVDLVPPGEATGTTVRFADPGRGIDLDANGLVDSTEGVSTRGYPAPYAALGNRDGLRQTTADLMAFVRALGAGADVDGDGTLDLRGGRIDYYGQSFGGIYGTLLGGVDPKVSVLALNVPGGPINEIARLSPVFRPLISVALGSRVPSLLNGGVGGFTESLPLREEPPVTNPAPGAIAVQQVLARNVWLQRPGDPVAYAPLLRLRPPAGSPEKRVLYQFAYGDQTVPNPTSANLVRAGRLQDATTLYRNDRTPYAPTNPHGFLLAPAFGPIRAQGQLQILDFFQSGGRRITDPDGPDDVWEVPVEDPRVLERLNYYVAAPVP